MNGSSTARFRAPEVPRHQWCGAQSARAPARRRAPDRRTARPPCCGDSSEASHGRWTTVGHAALSHHECRTPLLRRRGGTRPRTVAHVERQEVVDDEFAELADVAVERPRPDAGAPRGVLQGVREPRHPHEHEDRGRERRHSGVVRRQEHQDGCGGQQHAAARTESGRARDDGGRVGRRRWSWRRWSWRRARPRGAADRSTGGAGGRTRRTGWRRHVGVRCDSCCRQHGSQ